MTANPKYSMTPEAYLAFERANDTKHEYIDGDIYAMTGAQPNHNLITSNIGIAIGKQIEEGDCSVYSTDQRVKGSDFRYFYPDVTVVCGEPIYEPTGLDTLVNPTLIVEVLSPSTERYDRLTKARYYQQIESLQQYLFVAQDAHWVERFTREENGKWHYISVVGIDSTVELTSVGCTLALSAVYRRVVFKDAPNV